MQFILLIKQIGGNIFIWKFVYKKQKIKEYTIIIASIINKAIL